jgi:hypothetical protein
VRRRASSIENADNAGSAEWRTCMVIRRIFGSGDCPNTPFGLARTKSAFEVARGRYQKLQSPSCRTV